MAKSKPPKKSPEQIKHDRLKMNIEMAFEGLRNYNSYREENFYRGLILEQIKIWAEHVQRYNQDPDNKVPFTRQTFQECVKSADFFKDKNKNAQEHLDKWLQDKLKTIYESMPVLTKEENERLQENFLKSLPQLIKAEMKRIADVGGTWTNNNTESVIAEWAIKFRLEHPTDKDMPDYFSKEQALWLKDKIENLKSNMEMELNEWKKDKGLDRASHGSAQRNIKDPISNGITHLNDYIKELEKLEASNKLQKGTNFLGIQFKSDQESKLEEAKRIRAHLQEIHKTNPNDIVDLWFLEKDLKEAIHKNKAYTGTLFHKAGKLDKIYNEILYDIKECANPRHPSQLYRHD